MSWQTVNNGLSYYIWNDIPTGEIRQIIDWLDSVKSDCEYKISQLEKLERERARSKAWRSEMNDLAKQFKDPDSLHLDLDTRTEIVRQRLGCDYVRARHIAEIVHSWAKKKAKEERNKQICNKYAAGMPITKISREHGISRQHVYNIIEKDPASRFFS